MSQTDLLHHLSGSYTSVDDVLQEFEWLENHIFQSGDLRGVFATAYLHISHAIARELEADQFENREWSASYMIRFANLYREALHHYENNRVREVPKSWLIAFDLAEKRKGFIIQHLLLGINAHINHDLAIALSDVGLEPERVEKKSDYDRINQILREATDGLKKTVTEKYAPILKRLDDISGEISNDVANFSIPKARKHAWTFGIALHSSGSQKEKKLLLKSLDEQAAVLARLIIASLLQHPSVTETVSFLKRLNRFADRILRLFKS